MNQVTMVLQCLLMCGLMGGFCGMLVVPFFTWLGMRAAAPRIALMSNDTGWQAPLAAVAAALPALIFLSAAALTLGMAAHLPAPSMLACRIGVAAVELLLVAGLARAIFFTVRNLRESHRLIARSRPPSPALHALAARYGIHARDLDDPTPFCAIAGILHPVMLVSRGALARLSSDELRAAVLHERAHVRRGDQLLAAVLTFCTDCLPLPAADLVRTYRSAREFAADRDAAAQTDPQDLARAILSIAKGVRATPAFAALASGDLVRARVCALVDTAIVRGSAPNRARRMLLAAWLVAVSVVSFVPFLQRSLHF